MAVSLAYHPQEGEIEVQLPGSKSESNRLLILQFLSGDAFQINHLSDAGDTRVLKDCLNQLRSGDTSKTITLDCKDGGTPLRFLMALCALREGSFLLTGTQRLMQRPQQDLIHSLRALGASIEHLGEHGMGPWLIQGRRPTVYQWTVSMKRSSQFASALLLLAAFQESPVSLELKDTEASWPYVSMTLETMKKLGVQMEQQGAIIKISPGIKAPNSISVEADWSAASYFFAAQCIRKTGSMSFPNLRLHSIQGDVFLERLFRYEGLVAQEGNQGLQLYWNSKPWEAKELSINLSAYPDLAPALVVYYFM
ncbi:MAG: hypothetical protein LPK45_04175, partial [Bacteroidota bacterium]|nr:hypothetical protein [Bacteroidota bacterium]MDX5430250.1 hypothetical protein [Bacteroidota bacterium]MDX5469011.1 hypothetical protein [Bacteroidota bacterium]